MRAILAKLFLMAYSRSSCVLMPRQYRRIWSATTLTLRLAEGGVASASTFPKTSGMLRW